MCHNRLYSLYNSDTLCPKALESDKEKLCKKTFYRKKMETSGIKFVQEYKSIKC